MLSPAYPNKMAACTYAALTLVRCGVNRSRVACGHAALILSGFVGTAVVDLSRGLPRTLRDELVLLATLSTYHPPARHVNAGNQNASSLRRTAFSAPERHLPCRPSPKGTQFPVFSFP
ncbi:MAG: hypothetical protein DMG40_10215 [Acidobacteria bacterium]|nr:MAG: hypothetical protein DMG40_10215 [Acidobacteriota bacterium]